MQNSVEELETYLTLKLMREHGSSRVRFAHTPFVKYAVSFVVVVPLFATNAVPGSHSA
jgi:hypothetical protein